jgi:hypothetical protein
VQLSGEKLNEIKWEKNAFNINRLRAALPLVVAKQADRSSTDQILRNPLVSPFFGCMGLKPGGGEKEIGLLVSLPGYNTQPWFSIRVINR